MPEITSIEGAWPPAAFGGEPKVEPVVVGAFNSAFPFFPSPFDFPPPFVASFFTFGAPALGVAVLSEVVGATEVAAPLLFAAVGAPDEVAAEALPAASSSEPFFFFPFLPFTTWNGPLPSSSSGGGMTL